MKSISQALVAFQKSLKPVHKDSVNPFFKSKYADLSSILQAIMPILSDNDLAVYQPMKVVNDTTILVTRLVHSSGEWLESEMILPSHPDPQKYGSLITYYKRYQLQAMLGISTASDDNDGNDLSGLEHRKQSSNLPQNVLENQPHDNDRPASQAQLNAIAKISESKNIPKPNIRNMADASKWIGEQNKK